MKPKTTTLDQLNTISKGLSQTGCGLSAVLGFLMPLIALLPYYDRVGLMGLSMEVTIYTVFCWLIALVCHLVFYCVGRFPGGLIGFALVLAFLWNTVLFGPDSLRVRAKVSRDVCQYIELIRYPDAKENVGNDWTITDIGRGICPREFDRVEYWKRTIRQTWFEADYGNDNYSFDDKQFNRRWLEFIAWFNDVGIHGGKGVPAESLMPRLAGPYAKWNSHTENFEP